MDQNTVKNSFLKQELKSIQNTIDKLLEIISSQYKQSNYTKEEVRKPLILQKKIPFANSKTQTSLPQTAALLSNSVSLMWDTNK